MRTGLILIGGMAKRAGGFPKYLFRVGELSFLERQIIIMRECTEEILVISRDEEQIASLPKHPGVIQICDIKKGIGPSGGIQAGAYYAKGEYFFVTACDMPMISCQIISFLFESSAGYDAAVPLWEDGKIEPLCAVYRAEAVLQYYKKSSARRLTSLVENINAKMIPVIELRKFDKDLKTFLNINDIASFEDLKISNFE